MEHIRDLEKNKKYLMKIVPEQSGDSYETKCQGTRVFVGDKELTGITGIELTACTHDAWRAKISCAVIPPIITCFGDLSNRWLPQKYNLWQKFLLWLCEHSFSGMYRNEIKFDKEMRDKRFKVT